MSPTPSQTKRASVCAMKFKIINNGYDAGEYPTPEKVVEALVDYGVVEPDGIDDENAKFAVDFMKPGEENRFYYCKVIRED